MLRAAVVLCGCGRADGSEITESVATLIHLSRKLVKVRCFAPSGPQKHVVNHLTGNEEPGSRDMLVEAARIARGEIESLEKLEPRSFDMLVFPGGFGAAKNLCSFATEGVHMTVRDDIAKLIRAFHKARKPMGFVCIAPIIAAKVLGTQSADKPGPGLTITLGIDVKGQNQAAGAVTMFGNTHRNAGTREAITDTANLIVSTPAYMIDSAEPFDVFEGIGVMVNSLTQLAAAQQAKPPKQAS
jgi:enhancing lycopene biosynthesis protein 2